MASAFDQWEKDPFFYAAEEVQESADRLESVYRRWMHEKKGIELRREVHIALGTTKWQLEELERAVRRDDEAVLARKATVNRHNAFVEAISYRIEMVEKALKESNVAEEGETELTWTRLDEGERDELALFLSPPRSEGDEASLIQSDVEQEVRSRMDGETSAGLKNPSYQCKLREEDNGRIANGSAEVGLLVVDSASTEESSLRLSDEQSNFPPPKFLRLFELKAAESSSNPKRWYRNGFRKWKHLNQNDMEESLPLRNHHLSRGMNECYERSKSCLSDCTDESYHKNHHYWFGAFQRQLQRSQYQIQYGRPVQLMIWIAVTVLLLFLFVLHAS
ncbi:uncharacterized protein LOC110033829 [Phalaenopsis equestris]|uniref:uncharacterized protein LOC110033829 n=1 Tax=Phalaenopsis equestris TaxID=78828 RepID=UPI0009E38180|nr:uncharacterized protein LOC110033829 [Phalaenopsis equestris]